MGKIKLAITGCMGRMGQQLIKSAIKDKSTKLVALTENRSINKKISGIRPELNTEKALSKANVIIDFTIPKCTFEVLKIAVKLKKKVVIGTTGFTKKEENIIKNFLILGLDFSFSISLNFSNNSFCSLFSDIGTSVFTYT